MRYFIGRNGQQLGPFTDQQVRDQLASGLIGPDDLLWRDGMADWQPVHTVFPAGAGSLPPPVPASAFGGASPFRSDITREAPPAEPQLASRGKRLLAKSIDGIIGIVLCVPAIIKFMSALVAQIGAEGREPTPEEITSILMSSLVLFAVPMLILFIVQTVLITIRGQSLGKMWCKIRIVRTDGGPAGFLRGVFLRSFVMGLINNFVGVTAIIDPLLIYRDDHRCLHDMLADTTVIDA